MAHELAFDESRVRGRRVRSQAVSADKLDIGQRWADFLLPACLKTMSGGGGNGGQRERLRASRQHFHLPTVGLVWLPPDRCVLFFRVGGARRGPVPASAARCTNSGYISDGRRRAKAEPFERLRDAGRPALRIVPSSIPSAHLDAWIRHWVTAEHGRPGCLSEAAAAPRRGRSVGCAAHIPSQLQAGGTEVPGRACGWRMHRVRAARIFAPTFGVQQALFNSAGQRGGPGGELRTLHPPVIHFRDIGTAVVNLRIKRTSARVEQKVVLPSLATRRGWCGMTPWPEDSYAACARSHTAASRDSDGALPKRCSLPLGAVFKELPGWFVPAADARPPDTTA